MLAITGGLTGILHALKSIDTNPQTKREWSSSLLN